MYWISILALCIFLVIHAVELGIDAKSVTKNDDSNADFAPIIDDCRSLMTKMPSIKISHCFRKLMLTLKLKLGEGVQLQQYFLILDFMLVEVGLSLGAIAKLYYAITPFLSQFFFFLTFLTIFNFLIFFNLIINIESYFC